MTNADGAVMGATKILNNGEDRWRLNLAIVAEGYQASELPIFATDAQNLVTSLLAVPPWDRLQCALNVYRVDVTSTSSGADDPAPCGGSGATAQTYFDATFCADGLTRRVINLDTGSAFAVVGSLVPKATAVVVLINAPTVDAGTGWPGLLALSSGALSIGDVLAHELGHSIFNLGDEYEYVVSCASDAAAGRNLTHPLVEPKRLNLTVSASEVDRLTMKWADLVLASTALPTQSNPNCTQCDLSGPAVPTGTVGSFEGADYYKCGAYRPEFTCKMRSRYQPFCGVCYRSVSETLAAYSIQEIEGWFGDETAGAGIAVADVDGDGNLDVIVLHIDNPPGANTAHYRIGADLDSCGKVGGWGTVMPIGPGLWIGDETAGAGVAVGNIMRGSRLDLVMLTINNPEGQNEGWYRIGRRLDASGSVSKGWTPRIRVGNPGDWWGNDTQGADIAIYNGVGTGRPNLLVGWVDKSPDGNTGWYRIGWDLDPITGEVGPSGWSDRKLIPGWFGDRTAGFGIAVGDVNGSGIPDLIVFHVNDEDEGNTGWYRIGWNLSVKGDVSGRWTEPTPLVGWYGDRTAEAALAVTDVNSSGRLDLVAMHVDHPDGGNTGHFRIGWNLDAEGRLHRL